MKANELRIGVTLEYYLCSDGVVWEETTIDEQDIEWCQNRNEDFNEHHRPIPLTEDWLLKFGFKKNIAWYLHIAHDRLIELGLNNDNSTLQYYTYLRQKENIKDDYVLLRKDLMYVNQLQNLFFSLTGEELTNPH